MNIWENSGLCKGNKLYKGPEARRCCEERVVGSEFGEVRGAEGGEIQQEDKVEP